ncbi:class I SAM-dependent methyltransferase [Anaeromicropila herbilytica]|uniref:SAM-dependent methyltransferase n=1 Tax=Anaeromicropila herbilytica TaxID=2785025 RepID=A0A7R7EPK5_9FIRM|nr:SAM-dependent methyltransferase [Anaeromicropila herbilytica]
MERMNEFFAARVEGYDEHMLSNVEGCKEAYIKLAELIPFDCKKLLDLGCGTGMELDGIFKRFADIHVTGIDLTQAMLDKLKEKYSNKNISLICGSYFDVDFGIGQYDCAISFQTMHHFSHEAKIGLYKRILDSLMDSGVYIECDYMVQNQEEEDFYYSENTRIRKEMNILENEFYHYDTPCTIDNQIAMLRNAGFQKVEKVFRIENTTILVAYK